MERKDCFPEVYLQFKSQFSVSPVRRVHLIFYIWQERTKKRTKLLFCIHNPNYQETPRMWKVSHKRADTDQGREVTVLILFFHGFLFSGMNVE